MHLHQLFSNANSQFWRHKTPPLSAFSFNIEDYIEEGEVSSSAILFRQEEVILADAVKDWLREILPYLEQDIADLVQNAEPIRSIFCSIKSELSPELFDDLSPVSYIKGQESKVIGAKKRLANHEA